MTPTDHSASQHAGDTRSLWQDTATVPSYAPLARDAEADVVIVGAGIAGLSVGYQLVCAGKSVVILDDGGIGCGETERTTAHLSSALDDRFLKLEKLHGAAQARLAAESHAAAIDEIERIARAEKIECDFLRLDGYLFSESADERDALENECEAAHRAGLDQVEMLTEAPVPGIKTGPALRFPRQGQFNPLKYLNGLAAAITRRGGRIFCQTHVDEVHGGSPVRVVTAAGFTVTASAVVVATNVPINDRVVIHTKQSPYRSYVIAAQVAAGTVPAVLFWDTADPYHYVRLQTGAADGSHDVLIVGGEDHKTGQADDAVTRYARLEAWARTRFAILEVTHRWSGQVIEPVDGIAFIGRNPSDLPNVFIATGDSGHGMTHGTIAGLLLRDLVLGRPNQWEALYDPARVTASAAGEFVRENLNMAAQYTDWLTPGEAGSVDQVPRNSGSIVRDGLSKLAVYRDGDGAVQTCSAVCPHLGGLVRWNSNEKCWECPVHGSRFDRFGKVLNGPAIADLEILRPVTNP